MSSTSTQIIPWPSVRCVCAGDPSQMGFKQGQVMQDSIFNARESLHELDAFRLEQPAWMPYPAFRFLAELKAKAALTRGLARSNPAMLARLDAIAVGSGLPFR